MPRSCSFILALLVLVAPGCQNSLRNVAKATTGRLDPPVVPPRVELTADPPTPAAAPTAAPPTPITAAAEPLVEPTREEAFKQVLTDLQAIGRESPAAQQRLLQQLETADPAHWAPLVQRTRSTLLYQQQLAARQKPIDVAPASAQQPLEQHTHQQEREARAIDLSAPYPQTSTPEPTTPTPPQPQHYPTSSLDERRLRDNAVRPAAAMVFPGPASEEQTPYPVAMPAAATPMTSEQDAIDQAVQQLRNKLSNHPQSVTEAYDHVRLRLLQLAAGDLDQAATPPPGLTATEQQYWSNQLLAISTLLDHRTQPEARRRAAAGGLHLKRAAEELEQLGSLAVVNLEFCEQVYGFGAYEPLESTRFRPGQEVMVYAEVENYKSVSTPQGEHTSLATSYRVLDQHGGRVDGGEVPVVNDYCARRRRDFHIQYGITLPQGIYPGEYVLELTLTDQLGDKIGHGALDFEIVAKEQ